VPAAIVLVMFMVGKFPLKVPPAMPEAVRERA
jgi:hypothetical protein